MTTTHLNEICILAVRLSYEIQSLLKRRQNENKTDIVFHFLLFGCHSVAVFSANTLCLVRLSDTSLQFDMITTSGTWNTIFCSYLISF